MKSIAIPMTFLVAGLLMGHLLPLETTADDPVKVTTINTRHDARPERHHTTTAARESHHSTSSSAEVNGPAYEGHGEMTVPALLISNLSLAADIRKIEQDLSSSMVPLEGKFRSAVNRALGESRSQAFLAAKQVDRMFSPPAGERSYTVTTEEIGDGRWRYRMTLADPDGTRVWVGESIPDEIRHLTDPARIQPSLEDS